MNLKNIEYDNELNLRLQTRNIPSANLRPLFDFRPTPTKYSWFGSVEDTRQGHEPLFTYSKYDPTKVFNPSQKGSTDFYLNSIDQESRLQNRFMALQKADQAVYVPELSSTLYEDKMAYKKALYECENVNYESRKVKESLAPSQFFNHTRTNLKTVRK